MPETATINTIDNLRLATRIPKASPRPIGETAAFLLAAKGAYVTHTHPPPPPPASWRKMTACPGGGVGGSGVIQGQRTRRDGTASLLQTRSGENCWSDHHTRHATLRYVTSLHEQDPSPRDPTTVKRLDLLEISEGMDDPRGLSTSSPGVASASGRDCRKP